MSKGVVSNGDPTGHNSPEKTIPITTTDRKKKKPSFGQQNNPNNNNKNEELNDESIEKGGKSASAGAASSIINSTNKSEDSKYYDDLDDFYSETDTARPTGVLELKITSISKYKDMDFRQETKILSPEPIFVRCLPWKILFMLRTQNPDRSQRCMGFFLQCNNTSDSTIWHCHAKAELRLVCQRKGVNNQDIVKNIEHNFFFRENDWGYSSFITWTDLTNPDKGFVGSDDSIILRVKVHADAPHGVDWDSKKHTGFVGLKNQGATCYMNSLLQALFFTNKLRKSVYLLPTETDDEQRSVALALQRVFYELQYGEKAVGTKRLTKSFGWETLDTFMQHDAQELCRVLLDNLESKMKSTRVEDTIPNLFCGKMVSFVRCMKVLVESRTEEVFYDIQLKIKGNSDIYAAFDEYITVETLDGDNKYDAGEFGHQDAEKGIMFLKFPPVLYLHLMRFQYDIETDANIKVNDRFAFPYSLDLSKYLEDSHNCNTKYILHTVFVHSGDNHGGHYVAYLNPNGDNKWYKFDDDVVSRCSRREAILSNYGGNDDDMSIKQCTNAYMLVYISEADIKDLLLPINKEDIPGNLHQRFTNEKQIEDQKRKEKANAYLFSSVIIVLDEDFYGWQGYELFDVEKCSFWRRMRFPRKSNVIELTKAIADFLHESPDRIRLWCIIYKNNQIQLSPMEIKDVLPSSDNPAMIWVQTLPADNPNDILPVSDSKQILIFCKYYNSQTNSVHFMGWVYVKIGAPIKDIFPTLRKRAHLSENIQLTLWEERERRVITQITNVNEGFLSPYNGLIIIYEPNIPRTSRKIGNGDIFQDLRCNSFGPPNVNAKEFFHDLYQKVEVEFIEKIGELTSRDLNNKSNPVSSVIRLSQKARYMDILKALVTNIPGADVSKIQLYKPVLPSHGSKNDLVPGDPVRTTFEGTLADLISSQIQSQINATLPRGKPTQNVPLINSNHQPLSNPANNSLALSTNLKRLYFQLLKIPIHEVETMQQFSCIFVDTSVQEQFEIQVTLSKTSCAADIITEAKKHCKLSTNNSTGFRLFEVFDHRIINQISLKTKLSEIQPNPNRIIYIESIPPDEQKINRKTEVLVSVSHCQLDSKLFFGTPFTIKVIDKETMSDLRNRIRLRTACSEKDFEKWQLVLCTNNLEKPSIRNAFSPRFLTEENNSQIRIHMFEPISSPFNVATDNYDQNSELLITIDQPWLCLDHKMPVVKRNRCNISEKSIIIHN